MGVNESYVEEEPRDVKERRGREFIQRKAYVRERRMEEWDFRRGSTIRTNCQVPETQEYRRRMREPQERKCGLEWRSRTEMHCRPQNKFVSARLRTMGRTMRPTQQTHTYSGHKYSYEADREKWLKLPMKLEIEHNPFGEGGMRLVYRCWELENNSRILSCAKVFKDDEGVQAYFDEAMTQMVSESYAQEFNRECYKKKLRYNVGFVPVSVLRLKTADGRRLVYNVEPMLDGDYRKHNDNDGHVESELLLPQAFSHYTYELSNNLLVVVDIQGVGSFYTDPQIHTFDGHGFGLGNLGHDGLTKFLKTHECNDLCRLLDLPAVKVTETDYEMAMRLQEEENKANNRRNQSLMSASRQYDRQLNYLMN